MLDKNNDKKIFNSIISKFGKTKVARRQFHGAKKKNSKFWDVVISILIEMKNNCKCLIGYLDDVIIL